MYNNLPANMLLDTRLLTNLNGAVVILHFDPIRIECLSRNRWGNSITNRSVLLSPLDHTVNGIELVANIEEHAVKVLTYLTAHPTRNYTGIFDLQRPNCSAQQLIFNASIAEKNDQGEISSCICIILDINKALMPNLEKAKTENSDKLPMSTFSRREQEVIQEMMKGLTSKEIGKKLYITENTVETHRSRIYKKAGVKNVVGLVQRVG